MIIKEKIKYQLNSNVNNIFNIIVCLYTNNLLKYINICVKFIASIA